MLRAKGGTRPVALLGSDDEEVLSAALETSTPNRHTLATSKPRTTFNNGAGTAIAANNETSSSSMQSRRYHSKSLSLSEGKTLSKAFETPALRLCTFSGSSQLFQQNRSMWEKRTEPEGNSNGGGGSLTTISVVTTTTTTTEADAGGDRNSRNAAPDLVLDLPAPSSSSGSSSAGTDNNVVVEMDQPQQNHRHYHHNNPQPGSPDAEEMGGGVGGISGSGADCFAHNQFTLKKNDKFLLLESSRQNFSIPDNNSKEQLVSGEVRGGGGRKETSTTAPPSSVLHISEEEEQMQMQQRQRQQQDSLPIVVAPETVIAERNTHKFITQFADLKLTGGSLPMPGGGTGTATSSGGEESASELIAPFKPILRREKPQILRKPVLASSSSSSSTNSGPSSLLSFCAKGSSDGGGGDDISGTKSLE